MWQIGAYDPELNLTYWGVGNPVPRATGAVELGDNLYSNSVVALDADTALSGTTSSPLTTKWTGTPRMFRC